MKRRCVTSSLGKLRQSKRLKYDLEIYDRAREGSEQHTYRFLAESLKDLLTRERKRKNRDRIARSHGDKHGAAASSPRSYIQPLERWPWKVAESEAQIRRKKQIPFSWYV